MNDKYPTTQTVSGLAALKIVEPQSMIQRMNHVYDDISRRAYELFEKDGAFRSRDLDHWLKAESELLHPVHVNITEADDTVTVKAEVPGFTANELEVSLEPHQLTIIGKRESTKEQKKGKTVYKEECSSQIFRSMRLPAEVNVSKAAGTLKDGVLELDLPKAASVATNTKVHVRAA